jgi:hypothetical protein
MYDYHNIVPSGTNDNVGRIEELGPLFIALNSLINT